MSTFAKIKFTTLQDDVIYSAKKMKSITQKCVEGRAWCSTGALQSPPDYTERGYGDTIEAAKSDAAAALNRAHREFMQAR